MLSKNVFASKISVPVSSGREPITMQMHPHLKNTKNNQSLSKQQYLLQSYPQRLTLQKASKSVRGAPPGT